MVGLSRIWPDTGMSWRMFWVEALQKEVASTSFAKLIY